MKCGTGTKKTVEVERVAGELSDIENTFKIILVGDTGVGKSCLLKRIEKDEFESSHIVTLGGDFAKIFYWINHKKSKVQIWDTCGLEQYAPVIKTYFKGTDASLIIFDLTSEQTFCSVTRWIKEVKENSPGLSLMYLIGAKTDLLSRAVPKDVVSDFVRSSGFDGYFEISSKTAEGVPKMMSSILSDIFCKFAKNSKDDSLNPPKIKLKDTEGEKPKKKCC